MIVVPAFLNVRDSLCYCTPLHPPCAGHVIFATMRPRQQFVCVVLYVGGEFACFVAFYFIDVDVLIRPEDAQKYVSSRS